MFRFFKCFQVFWDKTSLSNEYALLTLGVFPKIKKEEHEVIGKIEAAFFIDFKPDYRDLI